MYDTTVVVSAAFMLIASIDYVRRAWIKETTPVPATWILMMVFMGLSFWMYWVSPRKSWTANIGVTAGIVNVTIILAGVIVTNIRYKTLKIAFDRVQKQCLLGGACVVVFWVIIRQPLIAYTLVQGVALFAYYATAKRLWRAEEITESLFLWITVLLATLVALYPAWFKDDPFSWIYLGKPPSR